MRRNDCPKTKWGRFFDKCREPMIDQDFECVNDIFSKNDFYFSDIKFMHNVVLANFYGKSLIQFYSGDLQRVRGNPRSGGEPARVLALAKT